MKYVFFVGFAALGALAAACGSNELVTPTDLVTVKGRVVAGTVPAAGATVYGVDHTHVGVAFAEDAALFPAPGPNFADGTGHFYFFGYGSSYDVVASASGTPLDLTVVQNLTRRDPVITLPVASDAALHTCHISTAWTTPIPAGASVAYFARGDTYPGVALVGLTPVDDNPADGLTASWRGSYSTTATFFVMTYLRDSTTGLPSGYLSFASSYEFLADQRDAVFTIAPQPLDASSFSLQIQPPAGYSVESLDIGMDLSAGSTRVSLAHVATPPGTFSIPVPDLPFNRIVVNGVAKNGAATSSGSAIAVASPGTTSTATLAFPIATSLASPSDGATDVTTATEFSWTGDGVNEIVFSSSDVDAPSIRIVTAASKLTLGQFAALSVAPFPAGAHVTWSARRWPDFNTTDDFETSGLDLANTNVATSGTRSFTIAAP